MVGLVVLSSEHRQYQKDFAADIGTSAYFATLRVSAVYLVLLGLIETNWPFVVK